MTTDDADRTTKPPKDSADSGDRVLAEARALADEAEAYATKVAVLMARLAKLLERNDGEP